MRASAAHGDHAAVAPMPADVKSDSVKPDAEPATAASSKRAAGPAAAPDAAIGAVAGGIARDGRPHAPGSAGAEGSAAVLPDEAAMTMSTSGSSKRPAGPVHLDVDLSGEGLGQLRLRASTIGGELHVALASNEAHVQAALAAHAPELRRDLEAAGLAPTSLDVGGSPAGRDGQQAGGSNTREQPSAPTDTSRSTQSRFAATDRPPSPPRPRPNASRLDLLL
jgi:flagellar hook-length control protein FliK